MLCICCSDLLCRLFSAALLPAFAIKEITFATLPWKFLVSNRHILWERTVESMRMFIKNERIHARQSANRQSNPKSNVQPTPHLVHIIVSVSLRRQELFLIGDASANLFNGLRLHFRFRPHGRHHLRHHAALHNTRDRQTARCQGCSDSERLR
jgi:hypothetical protein